VSQDLVGGLGDELPSRQLADPRELLLAYLDHYRAVIARKLAGLSDRELRTSRLPSGWSPLELLKHLVHVERRWIRWGFAAEPVPDPWGDQDAAERWYVAPDETVEELLAALHDGGRQTRAIVATRDLAAHGAIGGRFSADEYSAERPPPTLAWILVHVLEEYTRHAGHLDIARELADGTVGE
jgi:uncharacterized damage-inducible protein DinB